MWAELVELGPAIRGAQVLEHARAVARETMTRARENVELLIGRLRATGYCFEAPEAAHVAPTSESLASLDEVEHRIGPIPLSLRAFFEVVGAVDLRQSSQQLVHHWPDEERRRTATELELLGEYDPLVIVPLEEQGNRCASYANWFFLAPDEFHKANYSGGENYHVALPDPSADFPIRGMCDIDELFVPYLQATFAGGGFRGRTECEGERCWKELPDLEVTRLLGDGLLPI